jgi:PAS domain S-box-containing protein
MRLSFRLFLCLGVVLVLFFSIHPALATPGKPESFPNVQAPGSSVIFEHLTIEDGLSQNAGLALLQDHQGYLWIGTQDGLNRYDGYEFKIFRHDPDDPTSISNNSVISLYEDRQNNLWVGTWGGGLNRYDPQTGRFSRYETDPAASNSFSHDIVSSLAEDADGKIWVGTGGGLDLLDPATGEISHFRNTEGAVGFNAPAIGALFPDEQGNLWIGTGAYGIPGTGLFLLKGDSQQVRRVVLSCTSAGNVSSIVRDRNGILWIAHGGYSLSGGGLTRYDPSTANCFNYTSDPSDRSSLGMDNVADLYLDADGWLWITTYGGGLHRMDTQAPGTFYSYRNIPGDSSSLSSDDLYSIMQDRSGILWIGSLTSGINKLKLRTLQFGLYRNNPANPTSLASDKIGAFAEDWIGNIWVGTWGAGLDRFDPYTGRFTHYQNAANDPGTVSSDVILSLTSDDAGGLWVGTLGAGLDYLDIRRNAFTHYRNQEWNSASLINDNVVSLLFDRRGNLWVGTMGGLDRFDATTGEFVHYLPDPSVAGSISHPAAVSLFVDKDNILWVGNWGGGLNRLDLNDPASFNPSLAHFEHYAAEPDDPARLSDNSIFAIHQSKESAILWLGTQGGLNKLDPQTGVFKAYREKDGLRNATILGILEDDGGYLWLTTNNGLAKFNPLTETFRIFDRSDGLQSNEFDSNAYFESSAGLFYIGGIHGFNVFDPLKIASNPVPPEIVVTDFKIFNEPVMVDLSGEETVTLKYSQNFIAFDFAALDYHAPEKNQYAYILEGLDEEWIQAGTRRYASYTNLAGGEYVFRVKGSNSDGTWNKAGVAIPITVIPHFWQTWWFMVAIIGIASGAIAIGFQRRVQTVKANARWLEKLVAQRTSQLRETNAQLGIEIEQRKRAEEALAQRAAEELEQSEARFRAMFENAGIGIGLVGLDRRPLAVNAALVKMTGYSVEELYQMTGADLSYAEDDDIGIPELRDVLAGKLDTYQIEKRYVRKNGEIYWVRLTNSVVRSPDGKPQYLVAMIEDINERKHMLDDLLRSQARFQAVFENAAVGIAIMGLDRRALEINPVAEKIVGYEAQELYNIDPRNLALREDLSVDSDLFPELISGKRNSYVMERRYRRKNGEIFWARINYSLVRDPGGKPEYLIGMIEDIDEQKRASERLAAQEAEHRQNLELRVAERTEELNKANELLQQKATQEAVAAERTRLARDLHDAVTQTLFSATLIADVLPDIWQMNMTEGRRRLEELRQLTRGALAEMRTLLVELRPNALVEVPLSTLLRQLSEALTGRARIDIQFSFDGEKKLPPDVQVALYRIAQEALNNVVKHSKATQAAVMLRLGEQVRLSVTDNGAGFDPNGVTADHLGLKIMSERCEAIHAKFSLYSEPGEGTQVTVTWQD